MIAVLHAHGARRWCGPCLLLAKELEQVAETLGDKVKVLKIDVDENPVLSSQLRVRVWGCDDLCCTDELGEVCWW